MQYTPPPTYYLPKPKRRVPPTNPFSTSDVTDLEKMRDIDSFAHYNELYSCKHFRNRVLRL